MANSFYTETFTGASGTPTSKAQMDTEFDAIAAGLVLAQTQFGNAIKAPIAGALTAETDVTSTRQGKFMAFDADGDYTKKASIFTPAPLVRHSLALWNSSTQLREGASLPKQYAAFASSEVFGSSLFLKSDPSTLGGDHWAVFDSGLFLVVYHAEITGAPGTDDNSGFIYIVNHTSATESSGGQTIYTEVDRAGYWEGANEDFLEHTRRISIAGLLNVAAGTYLSVMISAGPNPVTDWNFKRESLWAWKVGELLT